MSEKQLLTMAAKVVVAKHRIYRLTRLEKFVLKIDASLSECWELVSSIDARTTILKELE